jgi:hypothetical protein
VAIAEGKTCRRGPEQVDIQGARDLRLLRVRPEIVIETDEFSAVSALQRVA